MNDFENKSNFKLKEKGIKVINKVKNSKFKHVFGFIAVCLCLSVLTQGFGSKSFISMDTVGTATNDIASAGGTDFWYGSKGDTLSNFESIYDSVESPSFAPSVEMEYGAMEVAVEERDYMSTDISTQTEQKLVYSARLDVETKDIDAALESIYAKIKEVGGIVQSEDLSNMGNVTYDSYYRYIGNANARIYVRIPQEHYEDFINNIETKDGSIVVSNVSKTVENMTDTYYDIDSRLRSLRVQEERLFEFMSSAANVSEMLDIEDRLTDVQYEIDKATNSLNEIDNDVKYSKVTLNITEVLKFSEKEDNPKNFFERLVSYIKGSADEFLDNIEGLLETVIYLIPNLILIALIYMGVVKLYRVIKKKRKAKKEKENRQENKNE